MEVHQQRNRKSINIENNSDKRIGLDSFLTEILNDAMYQKPNNEELNLLDTDDDEPDPNDLSKKVNFLIY